MDIPGDLSRSQRVLPLSVIITNCWIVNKFCRFDIGDPRNDICAGGKITARRFPLYAFVTPICNKS